MCVCKTRCNDICNFAIYAQWEIYWNNFQHHTETNTVIRSECWALTSRTQSKLQAAEMKVLRVIRGVTKRDSFRNEKIRDELNLRPLLDSIEEGRLRWYGHVMRMGEERMPKRCLLWNPQGKRPVWEDPERDDLTV